MATFWHTLPKPFLVLAPMDDVTDVVFREIVYNIAPPHVFFTEFTSADGLISVGRSRVQEKLLFKENQHPIVAQIWGSNPATMGQATKIIRELGFDGVDVNMGCPVHAVMKKGCGAGTIGNYSLTKEIIQAIRAESGTMSVSIKTRLGIGTDISSEWIPFLLEQKLDALILHGRTASQQSHGKANWDVIKKAVQFRDIISPETVIIGNGDVLSYSDALVRHEQTGADGIMIGRGIFHDIRIFEKERNPNWGTKQDRIDLLQSHLDLFEATWGGKKNFHIVRKFIKVYIKGFRGSNALRQKLMECDTKQEMEKILTKD